MEGQINGYTLSRAFFTFAANSKGKVKPTHYALYFYIVELSNQLGWPDSFGLPTSFAMEIIGVSSYSTYGKTLQDLISWGCIDMIQKSKNQFTANIVALRLPERDPHAESTMLLKAAKQAADDIKKEYHTLKDLVGIVKHGTLKDIDHVRRDLIHNLEWARSIEADFMGEITAEGKANGKSNTTPIELRLMKSGEM